MNRIAILVHQYGDKIVGGAESYARVLAEHLTNRCQVTVLTTTSKDYNTWENYYPAGEENLNGVRVLRFSVSELRNKGFGDLCGRLASILDGGGETNYSQDNQWVEWEGPNCPDMINFIEKNKEQFDVFIVFTYIYYIAIKALPVIKEKSIFIPTAHDETWLRLGIMKEIFLMPKFYGYLTEEERDLVHNRFHNSYIPSEILGIGIQVPEDVSEKRFREKYFIKEKYVVYVGRLDASKGCDEMISFFLNYKREKKSELKLVLIGTGNMPIEKSESIIVTGYVTDEEKFDAISGALAMITPSKYESLCISLLESMSLGIPVVANAKCAVLKGQCLRSNAGLYYDNEYEFFACLDFLMSHHETRVQMGVNGKEFIDKNYNWNMVVDKICTMIDNVKNNYEKEEYLLREINDNSEMEIGTENSIPVKPIWNDAVSIVTESDEYHAVFTAAMILSVIAHAAPGINYDIIVLNRDMTLDTKKRMISLKKEKNNISIRCIDMNEMLEHSFASQKEAYNGTSYFKLLIPQVMQDYKKTIYLDYNMIIMEDIAKLWNVDIDGWLIAGTWDELVTVRQVYDEKIKAYFGKHGNYDVGSYIQTHVLIFNIKKINQVYKQALVFMKRLEDEWLLQDQDILNIICKDKILYIDHKWSVYNCTRELFNAYKSCLPRHLMREVYNAIESPKGICFDEGALEQLETNRLFYKEKFEVAFGSIFYDNLIEKNEERYIERQKTIHTEVNNADAKRMEQIVINDVKKLMI